MVNRFQDTTFVEPQLPAPADWYGIRLASPSGLEVEGTVVIGNARAAIALENDDGVWPDLQWLTQRVGLWDNVTDITIDRDRKIPSGQTLIIPAGLKIGFRANYDADGATNGGLSPDHTELIVEDDAQLLVQGTPSSPVVFRSDNPVPGPHDPEWFGIRFNLYGYTRPGYGYMGSIGLPSRIENATIEGAEHAISIENVIAPSLVNVTFHENFRDIHLRNSDVFIPFGYWSEVGGGIPFVEEPAIWDLRSPTRIVASNSSAIDADGKGTAGLVDFFVEGIYTSSLTTGAVVFESAAKDAVNADDWGGIWLEPTADVHFADVDVGYATTLLNSRYVAWSGTAIRSSHFHHFRDTAIRIEGGKPVEVSGNVIERGAGLLDTRGQRGIDLKECSPYIHGNVIGGMRERGIVSVNPSSFCNTMPAQPESLRIEANTLDGSDAPTGASPIGLRMEWACDNRSVEILDNLIMGWTSVSGSGVSLHQCVGVDLSCNNMLLNRDGLDFSRTYLADGPFVSVKQNQIKGSARFTCRTDNTQKLKAGPWSSARGRNILDLADGNHAFVTQNDLDTSSLHVLAAQNNFWRIAGGGDIAPEDTLEIRSRIDTETTDSTAPLRVDISAPGIMAQIQGYVPCHPADPGEGTVVPGGPSGRPMAGGDRETAQSDAVEAGPVESRIERTEVGSLIPSPSHGRVDLVIRIRFGAVEAVGVDVFDVRGRRVRDVARTTLGSGEYRIVWDGRDESGKAVAAGTYFVRVQIGERVETRKALVLR